LLVTFSIRILIRLYIYILLSVSIVVYFSPLQQNTFVKQYFFSLLNTFSSTPRNFSLPILTTKNFTYCKIIIFWRWESYNF